MKVILANRTVYPFHPAGGIEKFVYYLSRALVRAGAEVEVIASQAAGRTETVDTDGVQHTFLRPQTSWERQYAWEPSLGIFAYSLNLARYLRSQRFDILHTFGTLPYAYLHVPGRRPVVYQPLEEVFTLDLTPGLRLELQRQLVVAIKKYIDRAILAGADAVAYTSSSEAEALRATFKVGAERLIQIPAGLELSAIRRAAQCTTLNRASLGFTAEDYLVVCVSRLVPEKGVAALVDAFALVARSIPQARLAIVGEGPDAALLDRKTIELDLEAKVLRLRALSEADLYGLLSIADCYVAPGLDLYWSLSVLEAMACGLPVVSTSHGQWVKDGENGYLVPAHDVHAMAAAVARVYEGGQGAAMGEVSRRIAEAYDYAAIAERALAGYGQVLSRRSPQRGARADTNG